MAILEELYSNSYLYVLPSELEGMPLSLLEAMSYGNCCVVSDIPECAEVVEDKAIQFKKADIVDLRAVLTRLCSDEALTGQYKKEAIGYLSGNTKLYPRFSIREYLSFLGELYGYSKQEITDKTAEIIRILDMEKFADNRIEKLSTGQTQRASIARCLMADPQLYILDEPTLGLDIISADGIIRFMKEQKQKGKTVLYSTHYLEEAQELCNRIYMICQGRIVAEGTPEELMKKTGTNSLREAFHYIFNNLEDVEGGQKNE